MRVSPFIKMVFFVPPGGFQILRVLLSLYRFFRSLKAAVCVLLVLIVLFAVGTFYEAAYGRVAAAEVIYQSWWMSAALFALSLNILAVMIDRWPWKKKHTGFLMAHMGILLVLAGAAWTRFYGIDGNMRLELGARGMQISTSDSMLIVYSSFDGLNLTELYRKKVFFYRSPPTLKKPYLVPLGTEELKVVEHIPQAQARENYKASKKGGVALRFHIEGGQTNLIKWLFKPLWKKQVSLNLGPAEIRLVEKLPKKTNFPRPLLLLSPSGDSVRYQLHHLQKGRFQTGTLKPGSVLNTGWMDLRFHLISYLPQSLPHTVFTPQKEVTSTSVPAVKVAFKGDEHYLGLNSHLFFFDEDKVYIVAYANEKKYLGFELTLQDFKIDRYASSWQAKSYESSVLVNGQSRHLISMNQPLVFKGYTVYQAGFEEDEQGKPLASVFSVNKDPGRKVKYTGSLFVILGSVVLFIRRALKKRKIKA